MKKINIFLILILVIITCFGCDNTNNESTIEEEIDYSMTLNHEFPIDNSLKNGENKKTKVIILLGQSNATGASEVRYLKLNTTPEEFTKYENGFDNILINFCIDNHRNTTGGEFRKTDLNCGSKTGYFGPEVGLAEVLSQNFPDEEIIILKYTMSGYSLNHHWLSHKERGDIYKACIIFLKTYLDFLVSKNYDISVDAICWMQGESDTTEVKANLYLDNQIAFVSYLREDLASYQNESGIYFIDAGISSSPYCLPAYPTVNKAKEEFAKLSPLNIYFPTIENELTTLYEPEENPDLGHYDALSEIKLGQLFGQEIVKIYNK